MRNSDAGTINMARQIHESEGEQGRERGKAAAVRKVCSLVKSRWAARKRTLAMMMGERGDKPPPK